MHSSTAVASVNALSLDGIVMDVDMDRTNTNGTGTTGTTTNGNHHGMGMGMGMGMGTGMGMGMGGLGIGGQRRVGASAENNENRKNLVDTHNNQLTAPGSSGDHGGGGVSRSQHGIRGSAVEFSTNCSTDCSTC